MMKNIYLPLILILFQSCFGNLFKSSFTQVTPSKKESLTTGFDESKFQSSVGIKSFEGIFFSFSALTGVPTDNQAVKDTYDKVKVSLPGSNKFQTFNDSIQKSVILLAGSFCDQLLDNGQALEEIIGNIDTEGDITSSEIAAISESFVNKFYREGTSLEVKNSAIEDYKSLLESLKRSPGDPLSKRDYIFSGCIASLGSLSVIMI